MSFGELQMTEGRAELLFTRSLRHAPEKVWRALTEPEHIRVWFPSDIEGERAAGAPLRFVFRNNEGPVIEGEMVVFDPPHVLEFTWGGDRLRFELEPEGDGTLLRFVNTFGDVGKAARDAAGWHVCLDALLADLDGQPADGPGGDGWKAVHRVYVERFPAEATTVGPPGG